MKYTFKQFTQYAALSEEERTQENFDKIFPETLDEGIIDDIAQKTGEIVGKAAKAVGIKSELERSKDRLKAAQEKRAAVKKQMDAKLKKAKDASFDEKAEALKKKIGSASAAIEKDRAALKRATGGKYSDSQFARDLLAQQNESFIETLNAIVEGYVDIDEFIAEAKDKVVKKYRIIKVKDSNGRESKTEGTLEELIKKHDYTLETGESYQSERGNKKINRNPKNIKALVTNIENAINNAAANGHGGYSVSFEEIVDKEAVNEAKKDVPLADRPISFWKKMFKDLNKDDEHAVDFSDTGFYVDQICNVFSSAGQKISKADAKKLAKQLNESFAADLLSELRNEVIEEFNLEEDQIQTIDGLVVEKVAELLEAFIAPPAPYNSIKPHKNKGHIAVSGTKMKFILNLNLFWIQF
jgi:hypothetical protein